MIRLGEITAYAPLRLRVWWQVRAWFRREQRLHARCGDLEMRGYWLEFKWWYRKW